MSYDLNEVKITIGGVEIVPNDGPIEASFGEMRYFVNINGKPTIVDAEALRRLSEGREPEGDLVVVSSVAEIQEALEKGQITEGLAAALRDIFRQDEP